MITDGDKNKKRCRRTSENLKKMKLKLKKK